MSAACRQEWHKSRTIVCTRNSIALRRRKIVFTVWEKWNLKQRRKILYYICLGLFCLTSGVWSHEVVELDNADEDGRGCARVTAQQDATGLLNKDGAVYFSSTDSGKHACGATNNNNFQKIRRCVRVLFTLITNGMKLFILLSVHFCIARSAHCRHFAEWRKSD